MTCRQCSNVLTLINRILSRIVLSSYPLQSYWRMRWYLTFNYQWFLCLSCLMEKIVKTSIKFPKNILDGFYYGSTWGITCFYDECGTIMRNAVDSGENFYASWGAKKEVVWADVERCDDVIRVSVRTSMDELSQIVDTAIWVAFGRNDFADCGLSAICKLHDFDLDNANDFEKAQEIMEEIEDMVSDIYMEHFQVYETLSASASFDDIVELLNKLEEEVNKESQYCFDAMVDYIRIAWDAIQEEANMNNGRFA